MGPKTFRHIGKQEAILSIRLSVLQLSTHSLIQLYLSLSIVSTILLVLMLSNTSVAYGQPTTQTMGVNITSPERGKTISVDSSLTVSGKSTDDPFDENCEVSVIVNNVRPYQPSTANGSTGQATDYSRWFFILSHDYTSIKEGVNEITARLSCLPSTTTGSNLTKWYSVNVTGVIVSQSQNVTTTTTPFTTALPPTFIPSPDRSSTEDSPIQESMQGENEPDIIEGSLFADDIDGENGDDRVQGSGGDDTISGGNGDDYLRGDEGNDNLRGENGDDMLFGGSGDDVLDGGNGSDNFSCGDGTDTIVDFSPFQGDVKSDDCEIS
jgi:RTX calcium-binding nonapeptide repeat (4 copies)